MPAVFTGVTYESILEVHRFVVHEPVNFVRFIYFVPQLRKLLFEHD